jgi:hypothetical protein
MTFFFVFGNKGKASAADVGNNFYEVMYIRFKVKYNARTASSSATYILLWSKEVETLNFSRVKAQHHNEVLRSEGRPSRIVNFAT